ncbi:MAG: hypothetical protein ACRDN9_11595 [Streptosporangiaceae bacterium]
MLRPLQTHEVGSLAKPSWRVKAIAGRPVIDADVDEARRWGERLDVPDYPALLELLGRQPFSEDERVAIKRWASTYAVRFFETAGLDVVYDGEQQRSEMYAWTIAHAEGFAFRGSVRSFDDKYYSKAAVTGPVGLRAPYHNDEFRLVRAAARADLKVPVTGPYTLAAWSFDEYYDRDTDLTAPARVRRERRRAARRRFVLDVAENLVRPNIEALIGLGADWIQIDEPAGSTEPEEVALMAEAFNTCVKGLGATFTTHLCFSDYDLFFPGIEAMTECQQFAVGFANDDGSAPGTSDDARPGYHVIRKFRDLPYRPSLGLGVLDIHSDEVESPELVRDRVLYAVNVLGDPGRVQVTPDCGLRTRGWDVAYAKLQAMMSGVALAKSALGP